MNVLAFATLILCIVNITNSEDFKHSIGFIVAIIWFVNYLLRNNTDDN